MKYLKYFESIKEIQSDVDDINDVLMELIDDGWIIHTTYTPKRWENPSNNYLIPFDYITVTIKKNKNNNGSKYPPGSKFFYNDIKDYIERIIEMFSYETSYKFIESSDGYNDLNSDYIIGVQSKRNSTDDIPNNEILGFILKITLKGQNLDDFKYHKIHGLTIRY